MAISFRNWNIGYDAEKSVRATINRKPCEQQSECFPSEQDYELFGYHLSCTSKRPNADMIKNICEKIPTSRIDSMTLLPTHFPLFQDCCKWEDFYGQFTGYFHNDDEKDKKRVDYEWLSKSQLSHFKMFYVTEIQSQSYDVPPVDFFQATLHSLQRVTLYNMRIRDAELVIQRLHQVGNLNCCVQYTPACYDDTSIKRDYALWDRSVTFLYLIVDEPVFEWRASVASSMFRLKTLTLCSLWEIKKEFQLEEWIPAIRGSRNIEKLVLRGQHSAPTAAWVSAAIAKLPNITNLSVCNKNYPLCYLQNEHVTKFLRSRMSSLFMRFSYTELWQDSSIELKELQVKPILYALYAFVDIFSGWWKHAIPVTHALYRSCVPLVRIFICQQFYNALRKHWVSSAMPVPLTGALVEKAVTRFKNKL